MNTFDFEDYKAALRAMMGHRRLQYGSRFTFEKMALACGVQKTYLSKVLNGAGQLNPDQLFSACEYLKLKPTETEFILLLRESQVTGHKKRIEILQTKIKKLKWAHLKTESAIAVEDDGRLNDHKWEYYTDVDLQLVHMFMTIPAMAADPQQICRKIGIDMLKLQSILMKLQAWKMVDFQKGVYSARDPKLHLSEDSPVFLAFGILNRIKTLEKLRRTKAEDSEEYFFSAVFSSEAKLQEKLKRKILNLISDAQKEVVDSKPEEVFQLNIDFFRWT